MWLLATILDNVDLNNRELWNVSDQGTTIIREALRIFSMEKRFIQWADIY